MPDVAMRDLIDRAVADRTAVAAFNAITLEHAEGIVRGAERARSPVVVQLSENAIGFHGGRAAPIVAAVRALAADSAVPVAVHLDHVESDGLLDQAEVAGVRSVMVDAGRFAYAENVTKTASATRWLHQIGVFVEAELGYVGGKDTQVQSAHEPGVKTDPDQAVEFVTETGVDALAVAVGSSHAMTSQTAVLDLDLIAALARTVPVPLVLHGSSGVPDDTLRQACRAGITKVNIGTALNIAFTGALRESLDSSDRVDPRPHLDAARSAVTDRVEHLLGVVAG